jgi:hypothetical protein
VTAAPIEVKAAPAQQWCLSVRARDAEKRVSPWTDDRCTAIPVDDVALKAGEDKWKQVPVDGAFGGSVTQTSVGGQSLRLPNVTAHSIALLVTKCPTCGPAEIYVDGKLLATLPTYAPKVTGKVLLKTINFTQREVTIEIRSAKDKQLIIDGIGVARAAP